MPQNRTQSSVRPADRDPVLRTLLFWSLVSVAVVLFAACALLPEWRETQEYAAQRDVMQVRVDEVRGRVERQERTLDALRTDPLVIQRVAERELRFAHPGEELLFMPPQPQAVVKEGLRAAERDPEPAPYLPSALAVRLPGGSWVKVFYDSPDREVCLTMAAVLFVTAFWLFPPRRRMRAARRPHFPDSA